jgi:RNA polymerase sigma-70 factor (ECF subfamily)
MLPEAYPDDVALLAAAAAGDGSAVRALLDATGSAVYGFVFARVGGDAAAAEDIVQEIYIQAMRSAHTFRGEAAVKTWLCTIARRRIARHFEAERKAEVARRGISLVGEAPTDDDEVERRDEVVRALGRLPAVHRQVLVLKYMDDLTVEQIAAELGRTHVQVQSLLQRARASLRGVLEEERS